MYFDEVKDFAECGLCGTAAVISPVGKIVDHGNEICLPSGMTEMGPVTKKLYETLMTREERLRSEDMGEYYRVAADNRDLNYDRYFVQGKVQTESDESYTSHNTRRLDVQGIVEKICTTEYVQELLKAVEQ